MPQNSAPWEADEAIGSIPVEGETAQKNAPWEQDEAIELHGAADVGTAAAQGFVGGAAEGGTMALSTGTGIGIGTALGGPLGGLIGGTVGLGFGIYAGKETRRGISQFRLPSGEPVTYNSLEEVPKALRPYYVGAETIGQTLPIVGALPYAATRITQLPDNLIGRWTQGIFDKFIQNPGRFLSAETSMAVGSGTLAGAAEAVWPGDPLARAGGEVLGGFFNPTRLVIGAAGILKDSTSGVMRAMSPAARQTQAGKWLVQQINAAGEDPDLLVRLLQQSPIPGTNMTAAQKTGSQALAVIEAKLREESKKFGGLAERQTEETLLALNNAIVALRGTGDPQALQAAARLQEQQYSLYVNSLIQGAERDAVQAAQRVSQESAEMRMELGKRAAETLGEALRDARAVERELWQQVPRQTGLTPNNTIEAFNEVTGDMLPEIRQELPRSVLSFIARMRGLPEPDAGTPEDVQRLVRQIFGPEFPTRETQYATNVGELLSARSNFLELARTAEANNKFVDARVFNALAEGVLDDLDAIGGVPEADEARRFSRALHDTFTRTFAGDVLRKQASGGQRIAPELLLRRATAGGGEITALRMAEMEAATRFLQTEGRATALTSEQVGTMLNAQERMLRIAAAHTFDPETGLARPRQLATFIKNNEQILGRFPNLLEDLKAAAGSSVKLQELQKVAQGEARVLARETAFGRVLAVENPIDAVSSALRSSAPVENMTEFARLATQAGPDAVEGLRVTIWDHLLDRATRNGELNADELGRQLLQPMKPGQPSLGDLMRNMGVFKRGELEAAERFIQEIDKVKKVVGTRTTVEAMGDETSPLWDLTLRLVGAKLGSSVATGGMGHELIAAQRGSAYMRQVFDTVPQGKVKGILIEALLNPEGKLMKALLETPASGARKWQLARQIHAYLVTAGLTAAEGDED